VLAREGANTVTQIPSRPHKEIQSLPPSTPLRVHAPQACASANSATTANIELVQTSSHTYLKLISGALGWLSAAQTIESRRRTGPLLAPARNARKTAGKTTAVSAGLVVSRHTEYVVGDAGAVRFRKLALRYKAATLPHTVLSHRSDEGHRGVVTVWASSTGTLAFGAIDFACRSFSCFQLPGIDP